MQSQTLRIDAVLEAAGGLRGTVQGSCGEPAEFSGWLALVRLIEAERARLARAARDPIGDTR